MITAGDVSAAVLAAWATASLDGQIGSSIHSGRLPENADGTPRSMPYAQLKVTTSGEKTFYSGSPQPYLANFEAEVTVWGIGESTVDGYAKVIGKGLDNQDWPFFSPNYLVSAFLREDCPRLEQEETRRQGEDVWKATLTWDVIVGGVV